MPNHLDRIFKLFQELLVKLKVELENGVRLAWPTPIFNKKYENTEELNRRLVEIIHEKEKIDVGNAKSIAGGWHSSDDVHSWDYPEIKTLIGFITDAITELTKVSAGVESDQFGADTTFIAWANILRKGGYHKIHTHPGCAWSGVYYIQAGADERAEDAPEDAGHIEFFDPRHGVEMVPVPGNPFGQRLSFPPEEGRLYCFPAWLRHMVNPYHGNSERITIGFNIRIENFETFDNS